MYAADTIVAPATPPGRGAVAIIRLSGPSAFRIAASIWHPLKGTPPSRELRLGTVRDPQSGAVLDQAMCVRFPAPRSLTGEDVVELHCHGGLYLVRRVLGLAAELGARIAEPGEFSRRAYLNGRIDLTAAEAVADIVDARGEVALGQAIAQLSGALGELVNALRDQVIAIRAHLEAAIDFADEDLDLPSREAIADSIGNLAADVRVLRDSFVRGRLCREGVHAAIIGKPNAGKSSLLNLLVGTDRAIVTPVPGTTRDVIEESISVGCWSVILSDTAGLRDSTDQVESVGIERTRTTAARADLLIAVFDGSRPFDLDDARVIEASQARQGIALLNKSDLPRQLTCAELQTNGLKLPLINFSTTTITGLDKLHEDLATMIEHLAGATDGQNNFAISRERHRVALEQALGALDAALASAIAGMPPEIAAVDVALAAEALGSITGVISTEDVLDAVFREFCIGK